ncbi:MAG: lectin [Acidobacteria bacterium]|nr:lectin [Acidobacteriota bacterium]
MRRNITALSSLLLLGSSLAIAQQPPANQQKAPPPPMSFFITSVGKGDGANLGGLAGADQHCQNLAAAAGAGNRTWRAYLSTQGPGAVNARDRIGTGPWFNARGPAVAQNVGHLHGDTLEQARLGNTLTRVTAIDEKGNPVNGVGATPNMHDMLTGSQPDGRAFTDAMDHTCNNWTSNGAGTAQLGHHDRTGGSNMSWNAVHPSRSCSQPDLVATGGAGLFYCFAIDAPR